MSTLPWTKHLAWKTERDTGHFARLKTVFDRAITLAEGVERGKPADLRSKGKLTPAGIREALAEDARKAVEPFKRLEHEVARVRAAAQERRTKFVPRVSDPNDIAASLARQEIRSYLRSIASDAAIIALSNKDPAVVEAILTAPAYLSGLTAEVYGAIAESYATAKHGPEIEELADLDEAATLAEAVVKLGLVEVKAAGEFNDQEFDGVLREVAAIVDPDEQRKTDAQHNPVEKPDPAQLAAVIKSLNYNDRNQLIDLALETQVKALDTRQAA
jgi:hypothetical protein